MRRRIAVLVYGWMLVACGGDAAASRPGDPKLLSNRGLYADVTRREVIDGAFEYEPAYPLWSDGADKRRWLVLPDGERVDTSEMAHWQFPVGAKLFKEFSLDGEPLETRLIERIKDTGRLKEDFRMATFVWRRDHSDAVLDTDGADNVNGTEHDVPAEKFCILCHRGEPGAVLGFSALQLSASGMQKAVRRHLLSDDPGRSFEIPGDDVERAALGTLHANCGHCHSETGMADFMHLRILPEECDRPVQELDAYRSSVGVELSDEWEDHPPEFTRRIVPGAPEHSAIVYRMEQRGDDELVPDQMPPLATRKVDDDAVAAVRAWIVALQPLAADTEDAGPGKPTGRPAKPDTGETSRNLPAAMGASAMGSSAGMLGGSGSSGMDGAAGSGESAGAGAAASGGAAPPDAGAAGSGGSMPPPDAGAAGSGGSTEPSDAGEPSADAAATGEDLDDAGSSDDDGGVEVGVPVTDGEEPPS